MFFSSVIATYRIAFKFYLKVLYSCLFPRSTFASSNISGAGCSFLHFLQKGPGSDVAANVFSTFSTLKGQARNAANALFYILMLGAAKCLFRTSSSHFPQECSCCSLKWTGEEINWTLHLFLFQWKGLGRNIVTYFWHFLGTWFLHNFFNHSPWANITEYENINVPE